MKIIDIPWWNHPGWKLKKGLELDSAELLSIRYCSTLKI